MFDFSQLDTNTASNEGVKFPLLDIRNGNPVPGAFAVMLGPESDEFRNATNRIDTEVMKAKPEDKIAAQDDADLERVVACTKRLIGCPEPGKTIATGKEVIISKDEIRAFYKQYPAFWQQLKQKIVSRTNFLPSAGKAGGDTSDSKHG